MRAKRVVVTTIEVVVVLVLLAQLNAWFNFFPYRLTKRPGQSGQGNAEAAVGELSRLAEFYGTDKAMSQHAYTEAYERFLRPTRYSARKILEIGIDKGASLRMFADYFPNASIYGIDISRRDFLFWNVPRIKALIANQADRQQLAKAMEEAGSNFDLILDDGGHSMDQQQVSLGFLFRFVKPGGYYILEDVHTSFMGADFGAAPDLGNTTYRLLTSYIQHGTMASGYMTAGEQEYVRANIAELDLLVTSRSSITCILKKREKPS